MNDESAFQNWLDAHPDDHTARLVFADWLEEHGDPRAEGYRALGLGRRRPHPMKYEPGTVFFGTSDHPYYRRRDRGGYGEAILAAEWFWLLKPGHPLNVKYWTYFNSRREAEDNAALAFARLPAERRAELLRGVPCS